MSPTEGAGSIIGAEKGAGVRILEAKILKRCNKDSLITSNAAGKYPLGFPTRKLLEKPRGKASSGGWWEPSQAQGSSRSMTLEGLETGTNTHNQNENCLSKNACVSGVWALQINMESTL